MTSIPSKSSHKDEQVDKEVEAIFKKYSKYPNKTKMEIMTELQHKYNDSELYSAIFKKVEHRLNKEDKYVEHVKNKLLSKYPNMSKKEYINKIYEYKERHKWTESTTDRIINKVLFSSTNDYEVSEKMFGYNKMSRALGFVAPTLNNYTNLVVEGEKEAHSLDQIIRLYSESSDLHQQVYIQSIAYEGSDKYNRYAPNYDITKVQVYNHIHPIVFALFIPKFDYLDQHMLWASIPKIIVSRKENVGLLSKHEIDLFNDIATDPSETACVHNSKPFQDLLARSIFQVELWKSVLDLRLGRFYPNNCFINQFMQAVNNCKSNIFDAYDLRYAVDEGTILRKLFSAFSLRPTLVTTYPVMSNVPMSITVIPNIVTQKLNTLPLVCLRLQSNMLSLKPPSTPSPGLIDILNCLSQDQLYITGRQIAFRKQEVIYSREILVIYVNRKVNNVNLYRIINPFTITSLPVAMSHGFPSLIDTEIDCNKDIELLNLDDSTVPVIAANKKKYKLKSVICVKEYQLHTSTTIGTTPPVNIIFNSIALVNLDDKDDGWLRYDPTNMNGKNLEPFTYGSYSGITIRVPSIHGISLNSNDITDEIQKKGTLYIYKKEK